MLVKCRICGKKVDRNEAFKVAVEGKPNAYYCSEAEYNKMMENRKNRKTIYYRSLSANSISHYPPMTK